MIRYQVKLYVADSEEPIITLFTQWSDVIDFLNDNFNIQRDFLNAVKVEITWTFF